MKLINIGYGNVVSFDRIVSILSPDSAPIKRMVHEAQKRNICIDATYGRRTRAVIFTDSDYIILSSLQPETISARLQSSHSDTPEESELAKPEKPAEKRLRK